MKEKVIKTDRQINKQTIENKYRKYKDRQTDRRKGAAINNALTVDSGLQSRSNGKNQKPFYTLKI